jgi:hypothetical protein
MHFAYLSTITTPIRAVRMHSRTNFGDRSSIQTNSNGVCFAEAYSPSIRHGHGLPTRCVTAWMRMRLSMSANKYSIYNYVVYICVTSAIYFSTYRGGQLLIWLSILKARVISILKCHFKNGNFGHSTLYIFGHSYDTSH